MTCRPRRSTLTLAVLAALLAAGLSCARPEPRPPVRIADLVAEPPAEPLELAAGITVEPGILATVAVDLPASRVGRLRVRARGDAALVRFAWKLEAERRFHSYRALTFPVLPDGGEHVYDVDLRREPYWTGKIDGLRFTVDAGAVELLSVQGLGADAGRRVTSLHGLTVPSLPGNRRLEVTLPPDPPRRVSFEAWVGLLPRFDHAGVTARFRAWVEPADGGAPVTLLDATVEGGGEQTGWRRFRHRAETPAAGRLVLEATAERQGHELPEGSALWGAPMLVPARARAAGPNLLLILVDTLRADVVGAYGGGGHLTPHIDELARRAVRFDDMLAPSPWTLPSVATLLTGRPPQVHGAGRRIGDFAPTALGDGPATLAEVLADRGLYTAGVYNNIYMNPSFGLDRGFDEYVWVEEDDAVIVDRAVERLQALADRRFFLFVHLFGPHHPYEPPPGACARVTRDFAPGYDGSLGCFAERRDVPTLDGVVPPPRDWRHVEALYRAEVAHSDAQVGRLLAGLRELGLAADTVVLVVSDHGEAFYDRLPQLEAHGYVQADHGHTHFRDLLRVPALLAAPGLAPAVVGDTAELADLYPTLLALLGVEPPAGGRDLVALLDGTPPPRRPTPMADSLLYGPARWSVRRGPWKLVQPYAPEGDVRPELYHLERDPGELEDVAADHPDVVAELQALGEAERSEREKLRRQLAGEEDVLNSAYMDWEHITKLRVLGYLK